MPEYADTIDLYIRRSVTLDRPEHRARMLEGLRMPDGSADTARLIRARDVCICGGGFGYCGTNTAHRAKSAKKSLITLAKIGRRVL